MGGKLDSRVTVDHFSHERAGHGGPALGLQAMQGEQRLEELRTPIQGCMSWVKIEGLNAQYREVLNRYPSEARVRSDGANGVWNAKCSRHRAGGSALDLHTKQGKQRPTGYALLKKRP